MRLKTLLMCGMLFVCCIGLSACAASQVSDEIEDQVANIVQAEDEHVQSVKNGTNSNYPGKTYGEAFENFFGSPTWRYFKGTQEGMDEDGDGKPDSETRDVDVVEFTGYCVYQDVEVKARIQFTLNDDNTFSATYLAFNEVPQNVLILAGLIDKAFTDGEDGTTESGTDTEQETTEVITEEVTSETVNEALFKAEAWEYYGVWYDSYSERCNLEIISMNDDMYMITIDWGAGAFDNTHWEFWADYDAEHGTLVYTDGCYYEQHYNDDGSVDQTEVYADGSGMFYIEDGILYWIDDKENVGADCMFVKYEE